MIKALILGTGMALSTYTMATDNPLSVHVLNLQTGLPSSDVAVVLEQNQTAQVAAFFINGGLYRIGGYHHRLGLQ